MDIEAKYNYAIECFENGNYDEAVKLWIEVYDAGEHQQEIIDTIYDCFITPNEQEFRDAYSANNAGTSKLEYEDLPIDFIYVAENTYYLFERDEKKFIGKFELSPIDICGKNVEFGGLMVSHIWDIRLVEKSLREKVYSVVYFLLDDCESCFMSFYKLPNFVEWYLSNAVIIATTELMKEYFRSCSGVYLPKFTIGPDSKQCLAMLKQLHNERLQMDNDINNIFLSICIPSYNRGDKALMSVLNTLQLEYDVEIEVIVSNNGSDINQDGYSEISQIKDSRLVYWEFEENMGYAENVKQVLKLARGKFAVLMSDEDMILADKFYEFISFLYNHQDIGAAYACRICNPCIFDAGLDSIIVAMNCNYISGTTINVDLMKANDVIGRFETIGTNIFMRVYAHIAIACMACERSRFADIGIRFFNENKISEFDNGILSYMTIENRLKQQEASLSFAMEVLNANIDSDKIIFECLSKTYLLLEAGFESRAEAFKNVYSWPEVIIALYNSDIEALKKYGKEDMYNSILKMCMHYLRQNPGGELDNQFEQIRNRMQRDLTAYRILKNDKLEKIDWQEIRDSVEALL